MRVGVTLPQFRDSAAPLVETARRAEAEGLDGVFVFDHLWPLGQPGRPALHASVVLGALAAVTGRVTIGTLVARVGLVPDRDLVRWLAAAAAMAGGGRFVAGLGTGDAGNRPENEAYGLPFAPADERLASLEACVRALRAAGVTTWVGGLSPAVRRLAATAPADGWNGWALPVDRFAAMAAELPAGVAATWAGPVPKGSVDELAAHLRALEGAGAAWAVCAGAEVDLVAAAYQVVGGAGWS